MRGGHRLIDLTGKFFGSFTVIERDLHKIHHGKMAYWKCKCNKCGSIVSYRTDVLRKCCPSSCGCESDFVKVGDQFGYLTVISLVSKIRVKKWECKCKCGKVVVRSSSYLRRNYERMSCGCMKKCKGSNHHSYKGYGDISGNFFGRFSEKARNRNIPFSLDIEYVWNLFEKQNKRCALSGITLILEGDKSYSKNRTASLDRIDSSKGYIKDNVQWVHKRVNIMKNNMSEDEFIDFCRRIYEKSKTNDCSYSRCG